jgi:hypothetical protein
MQRCALVEATTGGKLTFGLRGTATRRKRRALLALVDEQMLAKRYGQPLALLTWDADRDEGRKTGRNLSFILSNHGRYL